MAWQNNLREIRIILYRLKRNFGLPAILRKPLTMVQDVTTGQITRTYTDYTINRVVLLPASSARTFLYDLTYIAANKNFTYGAMFDKRSRTMIIDVKDLPASFVLDTTCHLVIETRRYEIKEFELAEHNQGWLISALSVDSSDAEVIP